MNQGADARTAAGRSRPDTLNAPTGDVKAERVCFGLGRASATFYFETKRRQDFGNFDNLDGCLQRHPWQDYDVQIEELTLRKEYDEQHPRIELTVDALMN